MLHVGRSDRAQPERLAIAVCLQVGRSYLNAREALLLNGKFIMSQLEVSTLARLGTGCYALDARTCAHICLDRPLHVMEDLVGSRCRQQCRGSTCAFRTATCR